jgi:ABC-2 type transport system ATP-binding protein
MNITIDNLRKAYGETVACDIDHLELKAGELIGLVGNNGAGKTTLFRLLLDLAKADSGHVDMDGINPAQSEEWKAFTGAYIDETFLIDYLSSQEYLAFLAKANGLETTPELPIMPDDPQKLIRQLSAGNKQKVGIAGAILHQPQLLILDEPFNFLDPSGQIQLKHLLTDYHQRHPEAVILLSSHNLQHTVDVSTRVLLLEHGRIVKDLDNGNGQAREELTNYFETE